MTYVNARYLDNERGVWLGRDPKLQFWSPYNYVGNNSVVGIDPSGEETHVMISESSQHASFYVTQKGVVDFMWDGAGGYLADVRGSGDFLDPEVPGFSIQGYLSYQLEDSKKVTEFVFNTTVDEEAKFKEVAMEVGGVYAPLCAKSASSILSTSDRFKTIWGGSEILPSGMKSNMDDAWSKQLRFNGKNLESSFVSSLNNLLGRKVDFGLLYRFEFVARSR